MAPINMVQALNLAIKQEMEKDPNVLVLGEDVGVDGGVFRVTDNLIEKFPDRIVDTPLAEAGIVGTAGGMALKGLRPIAEMQFSGFIYPAMQQIISQVARYHNRSRGKLSCPVVIRAPYGGGIRALEHHSESMESMFGHIPGVKVVIPSNPYDAKGMLITAIRDNDPVIFMEPKKIYRAFKQEVPEEEYTVPFTSNIVKQGDDVTIVAWGAMVRECIKACEGKNCEIIDLRSIYPLDFEPILESVKKTGRVVIVHEANKTYGPGAEISARLMEEGLLYLQAPVQRVTGFDIIFPLYKMENYQMPNTKRIINAIDKVMRF